MISTKLEVKKEKKRSLLSSLSMRPVLEPPCVGNFNNPLVLNGNLTPRANCPLVITVHEKEMLASPIMVVICISSFGLASSCLIIF